MTIRICTIALVAFLSCSFSYGADEPSVEQFNIDYQEFQQFSAKQEWGSALPFAKNSFDMGLQIFGEASEESAMLAYNYGLNLMILNARDEAAKILKIAAEINEQVYGKDSVKLIPVYSLYGKSLLSFVDVVDGTNQYNKALKIADKHYTKDSVEYAQISLGFGTSLLSEASSPKAKRHLRRGYEYFSETLGQDAPQTGYAAFLLGKYEMADKDYKNAAKYFNESLDTFANPEEPATDIELSTHAFLVQSYENLGQSELATQHCLAIGRMTPFDLSQEAKPIATFMPVYPEAALRANREGWALIEFEIDESGFVRNPIVADVEGPNSFGEESEKIISRFRFAPRFVDGVPVSTPGAKYVFRYQLVH